jgi:hypothetical protein
VHRRLRGNNNKPATPVYACPSSVLIAYKPCPFNDMGMAA